MQLLDRPNGTFTTQEIARLVAYRAAVAAGFYNDWYGAPPPVPAATESAVEADAERSAPNSSDGRATSEDEAPLSR